MERNKGTEGGCEMEYRGGGDAEGSGEAKGEGDAFLTRYMTSPGTVPTYWSTPNLTVVMYK